MSDNERTPAPVGSPVHKGVRQLEPERGMLARLQSLKVLLGTDSPEVRGWAPVVQQGAQATVNAAIAELKRLYDLEDCSNVDRHGARRA